MTKGLIMFGYMMLMALLSIFIVIPTVPYEVSWMIIYLQGVVGSIIQEKLNDKYGYKD